MTEQKKRQPNLPLLMPVGLLILEIIVFLVMWLAGYEINQTLFFFFILLGLFLLYQIAKQLFSVLRVRSAVKGLENARARLEAGQPMAAIAEWKKLLLGLPRDKYLEVLALMEETYQNEDMPKAAQQVKQIHSESIAFFNTTQNVKKITAQERRDWQTKALELRSMIKALPEE